MAIIGDYNGYTGAASVTYSGLASVPWLASNGSVNVTVDRIPDQYPLSAPQVVYNQNVSVSGGSITVPVTFQASHDAFAIYLTPATDHRAAGSRPAITGSSSPTTACALDVFGNTTASGAAIDQWTCNGQSNQQFQFVPGSGGYGELQAQNSGDDVTVAGSSTAAGTPDIVQEPAAAPPAACGCRCSSPTAPGSSRTPAAACAWTSTAPAATSASNSTSGHARTPPAPTRTSTPAET